MYFKSPSSNESLSRETGPEGSYTLELQLNCMRPKLGTRERIGTRTVFLSVGVIARRLQPIKDQKKL